MDFYSSYYRKKILKNLLFKFKALFSYVAVTHWCISKSCPGHFENNDNFPTCWHSLEILIVKTLPCFVNLMLNLFIAGSGHASDVHIAHTLSYTVCL